MINNIRGIVASVFFLVSIMAGSAQARNAYYSSTYLVRLNFSSQYFGAPVSSVMAHLGVVSGKNWPVTADVELKPQGDQFFGKTKIPYQYESAYGYPDGLSVVYLVRLQDGRQIWTNTAWVPVLESKNYYEGCADRRSDCLYSGAGQDLFQSYEGCTSADETYATLFTTYH